MYIPGPDKLLFRAVARGDLEFLRKFGATNDEITSANQFGVTLLMVAAKSGQVEVTNMLLKEGVDPNAKDCNQQTALNYAWPSKNKRLQLTLMAAGADPSQSDEFGVSPLLVWAEENNWDLVIEALRTPSLLNALPEIVDELQGKAEDAGQKEVVRLLNRIERLRRESTIPY